MIDFRPLSDDHPDIVHSPLLRAALLTLQYAQEHGTKVLDESSAFSWGERLKFPLVGVDDIGRDPQKDEAGIVVAARLGASDPADRGSTA